MDEKQVEDISRKLDTISRLLAFNIIKDKPVNEQIDILTKAGLRAPDIASILGKTENQVYVTQALLKKKKKESTKGASEEEQQKILDEKSNV